MAQHDYSIANGTGSAVRSDLNNALAAIVSMNSGSTEPSTTFAFQFWADTNANLLKMRNSANDGWIELRQLDGEFTSVSVANGTAAAPSIFFNASGTDTGIYSNGTDSVDVSTGGTRRLDIGSAGDVTVRGGNVTLNAQGDLRLADSDSSNWVAFQAPATVASNVTWTLPSADGTSGQALSTNGSGTLSWSSVGGDKIEEGNTSAEVVDTGSDGHFKVVTEGTEALRIDSSQRVLVGTSSTSIGSTMVLSGRSDNATGGSRLYLSTGTTSPADSSQLGGIYFSDDSENAGGRIEAARDGGTWTSGSSHPSRLTFSTTADGASSPTERMRIQSDGSVVCTGNIFTGTSSALLTDTVFSRTQDNDDANSKIVLRPRNAAGGSSVQAEVTVSGLFKFNSGYGSAATAYGCRAWVKFNGTGTVAINGDGGVTSISDNATGKYTINFDFTMPDTNYSVVGTTMTRSGNFGGFFSVVANTSGVPELYSTSGVRILTAETVNGTPTDPQIVCAAIFR